MSTATITGAELDFNASMVMLAGRAFPAALIVDPWNRDGDPWWNGRVLLSDTGLRRGWSIAVPMENGAHIDVVLDDGVLSMHLHGRQWQQRGTTDPLDFEVSTASVNRREIYEAGAHRFVGGYWEHCDPEWAAEHITRLSMYAFHPLPMLPEHRVVMRPLKEWPL